ncbi:MAG: ribonuclease HI [Planctomycetota bacterium]
MPEVATVYTDGACRGNPGPGGWGVLIDAADGIEELYGGEPQTTNNRMELIAAIRALEFFTDGQPIEIHTDSQYVKNGITTWMKGWKRNGWMTASKKPVKNRELWEELDQLATSRTVSWHWVKGHAGHPGNERADELANRAIDEL